MRRLERFSVFLSKTPHEGQVAKSCECKGHIMVQDTHPPLKSSLYFVHHCNCTIRFFMLSSEGIS